MKKEKPSKIAIVTELIAWTGGICLIILASFENSLSLSLQAGIAAVIVGAIVVYKMHSPDEAD